MAKTNFTTVEQYIEAFPQHVQEILEAVRRTIRAAVPEAEEVIHYQMPAYNAHGWVFYLSAYKHHYALSCPPPFTLFERFKEELAPYEVSKSAIKFPLDRPVPVELIGEMAIFRATENRERAKRGR